MRKFRENKETMKMTTQKLITALTAMLLTVLPIQGLSAANAAAVDTTLSVFSVDGNDVEDGDIYVAKAGTTSVSVVATPKDGAASAVVSGNTGLKSGDNTVSVLVTGSDHTTTKLYSVNVFVTTVGPGFSNDVSLASLKVNGKAISPNETIEVAPLTRAVTVSVVTNDVNATSVVSGAINLVSGINTVSVVVTAEDGVTTKAYSFKIRVLSLSTDVSLATFTVNGQAVRSGGRVYLAPKTSAVTVVAVPNVRTSSVQVTGNTGLVDGTNTLSVKVTAESGDTATYLVTLNVDVPSNVSTLASLKVSGARVTDGSTLLLPPGTSAVAVVAIPSDSSASVEITGNSDLHLGDNTLKVVVTAEDESSTTYGATLRVLADDDTSLQTFQYDGEDVQNGATFDLEYGTESVDTTLITAVPTSSKATVAIEGADGLKSGKNVVRVIVTAEDHSTQTYKLIFNVAQSNVTDIESITIGSEDATGGSVTLPVGTRGAPVKVITVDPFATYSVDGNTDLQPGENTVTVTVTAADGETTKDVTITVTVLEVVLGTDTSLESVTVAGQDASGGSVSVPAGTRAVAVSAVTTDPFATYSVDGNTDLQPGENTVTVTVTAADGETTQDYTVVVNVPDLSSDNSTSVFQINGKDVSDGESIDLPKGTRKVNYKVELADAGATYSVTGDGSLTPLVAGEQDFVLTVTAANGDSADYTVTLNVLDFSTVNELDPEAGITINGESDGIFDLLGTNDYYSVGTSVTNLAISAQTLDPTSDLFINGKEMLSGVARNFNAAIGVNLITFKVIPSAGEKFSKTSTLKVYVGGADGSLKTTKVGNSVITFKDGEAVLGTTLPNGTKTAVLYLEPTIALKTASAPGTVVTVEGDGITADNPGKGFTWNLSGLQSGENLITITVQPGDPNAEATQYSLTIPVAYSNDTTLKGGAFKVNGVSYPIGSTQILPVGTTSVELDAETNNPGATFEVSGGDELVPGKNTLTVTVTAEDTTTTGTYAITAIVPKAKHVLVIPFAKADLVTVDAKTNAAGNKLLAAEVKKIGKGTLVKVEIANDFKVLKEKKKTSPAARAAAIQKYFQTAKLTGAKTAKYSLIPFKLPKAKGVTVNVYYY